MMKSDMDNLAQRQKQVLDFISRFIEANGAPPTLREISGHIGTSGTVTALHHIEAIEKKGICGEGKAVLGALSLGKSRCYG
jgi:SOS-response transcriptional repressor LexA